MKALANKPSDTNQKPADGFLTAHFKRYKHIYKMLKVILYSCFFFATLASFPSLIFYFGDWSRFAFLFVLGLFIGLTAAPEFEPKVFKYPQLFQFFGGLFFGLVIGVFFELDTSSVISTSAIGAFLGATATHWVKHVSLP